MFHRKKIKKRSRILRDRGFLEIENYKDRDFLKIENYKDREL